MNLILTIMQFFFFKCVVVIQDGVKVQILIPVKEYIPAHTLHLCLDRFINIGRHFGHPSLDTTHTHTMTGFKYSPQLH